ncbi:MAG: hypothetical protein M3Q89_10830, partial [Verrucomicrobiota bacterium]|nr:hypothetical protein [Verrucomicrobiota bacterium]
VLALAVTVLLLDRFHFSGKGGVPPGANEKSIAVLPFENLTQEAENAFFADGIQDDILTSLSKIHDLKVISRTSVMRYREIRQRNLREIGTSLGAANILEGSVRRSGDRLRLTVQLIDARTDHHVWAEAYDRTVSDALTLQGELAKEIATALRATLSPEEKEIVERKPTNNADAYALYLRARQYELSPDTLLQDYKLADQLYEKAIALDPAFALAHARLATTRAAIFHYHEPLPSWKSLVLAGAEEALRLEPNLGEAHVALGLYYYWTERNYDRALPELALAQRLSPNDARVASLIASIRRRQGQWKEALELYERAGTLDPQNPNVVTNLVYTFTALRDWPAAARLAERLRVLSPDSVAVKVQAAYVDFSRNGSTEALKTTLDAIPAGVDPDGVVTTGRWDVCMIERDYVAAEQTLERSPLDEFSYLNAQTTPKKFLQGCIALARGDSVRAQENFEAVRAQFEAAVAESPLAAERHANLGLLYAFLGRKEEAVREGQRAVELKPEAKDALDGPLMNCFLALIYARNEEADLSIPLLERLLRTPGAVDSTFYSISEADLRLRWVWDPVRNDPRFQKMLAESEEASTR